MMEKRVSVARIKSQDNVSHLKERTWELLKPFGGIKGIIESEDQSVLLKPNLVSALDYKKGATTNPYLVKALVELIREESPVRIIIADGAAVGTDTEKVLQAAGFYENLSEMEVELRDLKKGPYVLKQVPGGKLIKELRIPRLLDEIDRIINLPVLKTHDSLPLTLGLKNMKGLIHEGDKKRFHRIGLAQAVIDLNKLCQPDFTVYDGTVGMEGPGPAHGDPVNLNLILAARDVVAGDLVAAWIMGFEKGELEQILLAEEQGLGTAELTGTEIIGPPLEELRRPFKRYNLEDRFYRQYGIKIRGEQGCSGCRHTLDCVANKLSPEELEGLRGKMLYLGPVREVRGERKDIILIGSCLSQHREKGAYLPGCPPHPSDLRKLLQEKSKSR